MGQFPASAFESFRVRVTGGTVPTWKVRLVMALVALVGLAVFLLLLPLLLFVVVLAAVWVLAVRVRLWAMGLRGRAAADESGRENVRVLVRDA